MSKKHINKTGITSSCCWRINNGCTKIRKTRENANVSILHSNLKALDANQHDPVGSVIDNLKISITSLCDEYILQRKEKINY